MNTPKVPIPPLASAPLSGRDSPAFLSGGGEMGALMRGHDWASTSLGAPETWPQGLRTAVRFILNTGHPMYIFWGPDLLCLYNDAYARAIGRDRHPSSLGRPGREVWDEIWRLIASEIEQVMRGEGPTLHENALVPMTRNGRLEDTYWTYSYGPIDDDASPEGIGGVMVVCTETTVSVRDHMRQSFLLTLTERLQNTGDAQVVRDLATELLGERLDVAQVGFGEVNETGDYATVQGTWNDGRIPSAVGTWNVNDFAGEFIDGLRAGRTIAIPDVTTNPRTNGPAAAEAFARTGIRALINVPLIQDGQWVALLFIHHPEPRAWTGDEVAIVEETAHRLWSAVQQATAEATLKSSEARLRRFVDRAPASIAMFDVDMHYLSASQRYLQDYRPKDISSTAALLGRSHYEVLPDLPQRWRDAHRRVLSGETVSAENDPFPRADGRMDWVRWEMAPWYRKDETIGGATLFSEIVTARVEAVRALAEREALFRMSQEAGQVGSFVLDLQAAAITLSDEGRIIFGLRQDTQTLPYKDWLALLHPDDRAHIAGRIATFALSGASESRTEYRIVRPDGTIRHIEGRCRLVRDDKGRFERSIGVHIDVTERKRAEYSLRESEARFRGLVNAASYVVYRMNPDWTEMRQLDGNGFLADTGAPSKTWLTDYIPADDQSRVWDAIQTAIRTKGAFALEHRVRRVDGGLGWTLSHAIPILNAEGQIREWFGAAADVTARKRTEEALRESEARFRALVEAMPTMVFSVLPDGHNEFLNQQWVEYTGLDAETGAGWGWADVVHPDDHDRNLAEWNNALATGNPFQIERRLRAKDGSYRWFLTRAVPVRDQAGRITRWLGSSTDIQDIVNAREVMARSQAELEQLVEERTHSLQQIQTRLAHLQRMEALGQLAGGIAHDFNNVLQAVQGGSALIERRPSDPESVRRLARMVFEAAGRGSSITRRLLAFARRGDLQRESVNVVSLLTDMREILTHTLGAGIGVRVNATSDLPALLADKGQLETVLVNLASNARDAMAGSGLLTLSARLDIVDKHGDRLGQLKPGSYICLAVTDTGAGMSPELLARVTEPFFTTKEHGQGTGLGLALARGFAEQSGGGMRIDSMPGQGTTVRLWFPLASAVKPASSDATGHCACATPRSARLIVVDDEPAVREIITEQLEAAGYSVLPAATGIDALAALDTGEDADLIMCDLSMPGMDGITLIQEARRRRPKLPAILLTGFATHAAEMGAGAKDGMFSLLRKPVTMEQLTERVATVLEGTTTRRD